jgi:hypothetical protein
MGGTKVPQPFGPDRACLKGSVRRSTPEACTAWLAFISAPAAIEATNFSARPESCTLAWDAQLCLC